MTLSQSYQSATVSWVIRPVTHLGQRSLYACVRVCVSVSQASETAEPTHVIRVNGAQSFTMIAPEPFGPSETVFASVCESAIQAS